MKRRDAITTTTAAVAAALSGGSTMAQANSKTIAVIGTGRMGGAFGAAFTRAGHKVIYGSRNPADEKVQTLVNTTAGSSALDPKSAAAKADVVILAVPWAGTEDTMTSLGDISGKLVLDPTNAIQFGKEDAGMAVETSGGEMVRDWARGAKVVKAFNTVGYFVIADTSLLPSKVGCFLASDDAAAKAEAKDMISALGFEAVDVGPMKSARVLEGMSTLYMVPYMSGKQEERFEWSVVRSGNVKLGPVRTAG